MNISRKIGIVVIVCVLLVSLVSLTSFYLYSKNALLTSTIEDIKVSTQQRSYRFNTTVEQVEINLTILSKLLKSELKRGEHGGHTTFEERVVQSPDGAWRSKEYNSDLVQQTGLFLPSTTSITEDIKQHYSKILDVFDDFSIIASESPLFDNIWMLGHDRSEVIFDLSSPDYVYLMDDSNDYRTTPWMMLTSPESNPERVHQWTPPLFEPVIEKWMTSITYPLDIDGQWVGTLGIDLDLNNLIRLFEYNAFSYESEQHFILDKDGNVIVAGPWQKELEDTHGELDLGKKSAQLTTLFQQALSEDVLYLGTIFFQNTEYLIFANVFKPMGWHYYRLIPTDEVIAPLTKKTMNTLMLIVMVSMLLGLLINNAVARLVVRPLIEMKDRAKAYALGYKPPKLTITTNDEVMELNDAFESMRITLNNDAEKLLQSQRSYQQVITSINEVLIQIDSQHRWKFLSPVWYKLSGYELQNSLNQDVTQFFHPAERVYLTQILSNLFEGQKSSWTGVVRLKRQEGYYIWGNLSLKMSKTNDGGLSGDNVSGTFENIHLSHITGEINKLIRQAEQIVLTSNCSVSTILEYVTESLVTIFDLPLVWVKVCKDFEGQILSDSGELSGFLYENDKTWKGLHQPDSPVIESVRTHTVIRVKSDEKLPAEWLQRLKNDDIQDSLFLPFYLAGGETHASIGMHSCNKNTFDEDFQQLMTYFSSGLRLICQMIEDQNLMKLHRAAVENTANSIMITDRYGKIEWVNNAFTKMTQFLLPEVQGKTPKLLNPESEKSLDIISKMKEVIKTGQVWNGETINNRKDGVQFSAYQTVTPLISELGEITHYITVSEDISERKENELRIAFMATHDELTGLPNRNLLHDRLNHAIGSAKRASSKMAVLFIDIDHFKFINDSLGHQIGDKLLKMLSERLKSVLREEDTVARFGGDEFVVVLPKITTLHAVNSVAKSLLDKIKKPYEVDEHELIITGSIGISIYPDNAATADVLVQHADSAMYSAKQQGRNNAQFYTVKINEAMNRRLTLEKALRRAVELEQLVLYYQPKVDLDTHLVSGMEALIRWQHPELGLISPIEFIPLAEETGVILEIGDWVISTACAQMKLWEQEFPQLKNISINVSPRQFWQSDFIENVTQIFAETGVTVDKVEFELTESIVMKDADIAILMMKRLKQLGVSLSIDDFGTGYSSLSYLQNLPVDVLKIDRSFVNDLQEDGSYSAIIRSIIALADNFNLKVVAEGIELEYQDEILYELGCQYGQGYYYSRPLEIEAMTKLLAKQNWV